MWRLAIRKTAPAAVAAATTMTAAEWTATSARQENESENHSSLWMMQQAAKNVTKSCFWIGNRFSVVAQCEAVPPSPDDVAPPSPSAEWMKEGSKHKMPTEEEEEPPVQGFQPDAKGDYYGLFPARQLWKPAVEYPLWDVHWDGKHPPSTGDDIVDKRKIREIRKHGVTRHIICIRHGQYDETHKEDEKRILTDLGRQQAALTGQRLAAWLDADVPIRSIRVSDMTRAKETAAIIATYLPGVQMADPDSMLNEGRPCHHIPGGKASPKTIQTTDDNHPRIESVFQKYFHRADYEEKESDEEEEDDDRHYHEVEIIVCHANVIRYFLCRALQLPPEAWLRYCPFNCSLTYFTIRPTGTVSCRMVGDIGHLPYEMSTFSQHAGFLW